MNSHHAHIILDSPRVIDARSRDGFTDRLVNIVGALNESLHGIRDTDASEQLAYLSWYLCDRTGGGLCDCAAVMAKHCSRQRCCMLTPIE